MSQSKEYVLEKPNSSNNLISNIIYSVGQSESGYMFFGTDEGLVKYNGLCYESINLNTKGNAIHNVICDKEKVYGLTFNKELFVWTEDTIKIFSEKDDFKLSKLSWLKMIGDSLFVFNPSFYQIIDKQNMEVVYTSINENSHITWNIYKENNTLKVLFDNYKIELLNDYKKRTSKSTLSKQLLKPFMVSFKGDNYCIDFINNSAYLCVDNDIKKLKWDISELENQKIHSINSYQNKLITVATYNGLYLLNEKGEIEQHLLKGIPVSNVFESSNGELWIATLNDGVFYIPNLNTLFFDLKNYLGNKDKIHRAIYDKDNIILGTHQGQVLKYNLKINQVNDMKISKFAEVQSISKIDNNYYVYCEKLYQLDTNLNVLDSIKITATKSVSQIKNSLYIGTSQGIYVYNDKTLTKELFKKHWFKSLQKNINGTKLYANTDFGVYILDINTNHWEFDSTVFNFQSNFNSGLEAYVSDNKLTVKSPTKKTVTPLNSSYKKYYLFNNLQYAIQFEDSINIVDFKNNNVINFRKGIDYYNQNIINCNIFQNQLAVVFDDKIQFLQLVQQKNTIQPLVLISNCSQKIINSQINLPFQGSVSFDIDVLPNLHDKGHATLFYRISNLKDEWTAVQPNIKTYNLSLERLPPGTNTLELKAMSVNGVHSKIKPLTINVAIPFWLKWWFIALVVVFIFLLSFVLIRLRLSKIKKKNRAELNLKRLEIQSLNSKLEALQSQMNPHFIFNALNSIQTLVLKGDIESSYTYITKFADLVRQTLNFSENQLVPLKDEIELLNNYLTLEKLRFRDDFNFTIEVDKIYDISVPPMLLQPLIENALKHGLLHKKSNRMLLISFNFDNELTCIITDNGIGRQAAADINKRQNKNHKSYAMDALKLRFDFLKQKMNFENIGFKYYDLYDNNQPIGTKVVVIIPFVKNY